MRSEHVSVVIRRSAAEVCAVAGDPGSLPRWAAGLAAGEPRREGEELVVDSPMGTVRVRFAPANSFGVLDHDVRLPDGEVVTNPLRVVPHPDGSEVIFTVRQRGMAEAELEADVAAVRADLERLRDLLESTAGEHGSWEVTTHDWQRSVDRAHLQQIRDDPGRHAAGGLRHLVLEVLAYAQDEAEHLGRTGHAVVTQHQDGSVSVVDDGRGTDTRRDAAGRVVRKPVMATPDVRFFGQPDPPLLPDGLPRQGMSTVAVLSEWLEHSNHRTSGAWTQRYEHGIPADELRELPGTGRTGTGVRFRPATAVETGPLTAVDLDGFDRLRVELRTQTAHVLEVRGELTDEELDQLHARAFGDDPAGVPWRERLERHSLCWVTARVDDVLVGFVNVVGDGGAHAILLDTCVDPAHQGLGIGAALVDAAADEAGRRGCRWLHADYAEEQADFYERTCGLRPTRAGLKDLS